MLSPLKILIGDMVFLSRKKQNDKTLRDRRWECHTYSNGHFPYTTEAILSVGGKKSTRLKGNGSLSEKVLIGSTGKIYVRILPVKTGTGM